MCGGLCACVLCACVLYACVLCACVRAVCMCAVLCACVLCCVIGVIAKEDEVWQVPRLRAIRVIVGQLDIE
jgi:hypothetical protein